MQRCFSMILLVLFLLLSQQPVLAAGKPASPPDSGASSGSASTAVGDEAVSVLREYLAIDTTNPPGNESAGAAFLKKILDKEGIENQVFDLGNNRANLFAIVRGDGSKRPVILLHHIDVVPADAKFWKTPPFSGNLISGEIYGRGALDIKGKGIIDLMTMIYLKRSGVSLKRDLIFLAVADEEGNSAGSRWMVKNKPELIKNAEFLIDEGTYILVPPSGKPIYTVSLGEKAPLWLTVTFTGQPGHGSVPFVNSAPNRAIRAANRILNYRAPIVNIPELEEFIGTFLEGIDISRIPGYSGSLRASLKNPRFVDEITKIPDVNSCFRNTIALTRMSGSDKINTIPNEASIGLDCRLLPGQSREAFLTELKKVINDKSARITIEEYSDTALSPADTDFVKALRVCANTWDPGARVIPTILLCSTDSSFYRSLGIQAYGFEPYRITDDVERTAHGNDERISVENVKFGVDLLADILLELNK